MGRWSVFKDLTPLTPIPSSKGRCVRCYGVPSTYTNDLRSLELILHDEEGVRFHFTVPQGIIKDFKDLFEEGHTYALQNFVVTHNTKYRTTSHEYKAVIIKETKVRLEQDETFPNQIYSFKSFEEIKSMNVVNAVPIDVIAKVVHKNGPKEITTKAGVAKKLIDLILEDMKGDRLDCTLWENYADECITEFRKHEKDINIIILQLCKPTMHNGSIKLSNGYNHTKILLNRDLPQVHEFRQSYMQREPTQSMTIISGTSQGTMSTISEDISAGIKFLPSIKELSKVDKGGMFWICGTVMNIDTSDGWFYNACKKCHSKLKKVENSFFCKKCNTYNACGSMRYKLTVFLADQSGSDTFILWDREGVQLIGKQAAELIATGTEGLENTDLPAEIGQALLNQKLMIKFKVAAGERWKYNSVSTLTNDPQAIATYATNNIDSQESNSIALGESSNSILENIGEDTPNDTNSKLEMASEWMEDGSTKRCLMDEFSSTKPSKKSKISIKQEKE